MMRLLSMLLVPLVANAQAIAYKLSVEYLRNPLTIDVASPKFSWALSHPQRGQYQTDYRVTVSNAQSAIQWDSGRVAGNNTLNIVYQGNALQSDADYTWTVTWWDAQGQQSSVATSTFSTALYQQADWAGSEWVSSTNASAGDGGLNTYRSANINLAAPVVRARLYIAGLGYWKAWINGQLTDNHELGTFTTFEKRVLYDVVDVTNALRQGCNTLGIMLGNGWFSQRTINSGPRQFLALLSVTTADGIVTYYPSSTSSTAQLSRTIDSGAVISPLTFTATAGPVLMDDIYDGEVFDGRIAAALSGWSTCTYQPQPGSVWQPTVAPARANVTLSTALSSHTVWITTDRSYGPVPGTGITQPLPGIYVFDFGQNMAGQVELKVRDCPRGTNITLFVGEILYEVNHTVHNHYAPKKANMTQTYLCSGATPIETYRTLFSYYGMQYVEVHGWPGVPGEDALTAHFVHSDLPQTGQFSSSSDLLNAIQHATRYASFSNLMDVPTDCPQRERRGWLGDAWLSFETVIHNWDGGAFYTKWIRDFVDAQVYDNVTYNASGAMPDCIPFYGHGHTESDPGWGIAAWFIPDFFAEYYDDDSFEQAYYPSLKWYIEHWINLAATNPNGTGIFPVAWWGDWAEYYPGPYKNRPVDYADFFYVLGLQKTLDFATRLNISADVARYSSVLAEAQQQYLDTYYNATTHCYADCMYVSQIFGLTLGLQAHGSADEAAVWANAMSWFDANGVNALYPDHFGGGIIALKLVYPLLDYFGQSGLGLHFQLQTDEPPSFGYWIAQGATTLWEGWNMTAYSGGYPDDDGGSGSLSYNHIMFGGSGNWYYSTLAGLDRADGSRSWSNLVIRPPGPATGILGNLSWASASIDSPMGLVSSAWQVASNGYDGMCGSVDEEGVLNLTCNKGTFTGVKFASFGTPTGDCNLGFQVDPSCNSPNSVSVVTSQCVGQSSCLVNATAANFGGNPCPTIIKSLAVSMAGTCVDPNPLYSLQTAIPANAVATVILPTVQAPSTVTVTESGSVVWQNGAYVPGVAGISGATANADGLGVTFSVGSGSYSFVVNASG